VSTASEIDRELRRYADPVRAGKEKAYLKSDLEHLGVTVPRIRAVTKAVVERHDLGRPAVVATVEELWSEPLHERRMAAVELLELHVALLETRDIELLERLIRQSRTWALVDGLAASVVGPLVERFPELAETLDRWAGDDDFWVRRSAMLALLGPLRRGEGDFERFGRYADGMLDEKGFFVRKAIGWVLRETGRRRPELVYAWLLPRAHRASGVTLREAVKYLPAVEREELLAAAKPARARAHWERALR
jgi:3-methyladenine DNA glycosylase AlkD